MNPYEGRKSPTMGFRAQGSVLGNLVQPYYVLCGYVDPLRTLNTHTGPISAPKACSEAVRFCERMPSSTSARRHGQLEFLRIHQYNPDPPIPKSSSPNRKPQALNDVEALKLEDMARGATSWNTFFFFFGGGGVLYCMGFGGVN